MFNTCEERLWEVISISETLYPIRSDYLAGMSFTAIGEKYLIDPRTAKRYALNNLPLEYLDKRPFTSVLDPYKVLIDQWLLNGRIFATTIHDHLIEQGCKCSYTIVNDYVNKKITEYEKTGIYKPRPRYLRDRTSLKDKISIEKQIEKGK